MKIAIGSDHGGFLLKERLRELLSNQGWEVADMGTYSVESVDYPDYAKKVARAVQSGEVPRGILICGTGLGVSMVANKFRGIRAAVCSDEFSARMSRRHNNANILCLGERVLGVGLAESILAAWLEEEFEGGRHQGRLDKIAGVEMEQNRS